MSRRERREKAQKIVRKTEAERKRQRRSQWRGKLFVQCGLGVLLLLFLSLLGGYIWFRNYLHSAELRHLVEHQLGNQLGGTVQLSPQDWQGSTVKLGEMNAHSPGPWRGIQASGLEADFDFGKAWSGVWQLDSLDLASLSLLWQEASASPSTASTASLPAIDARPARPQKKAFWDSWMPQRAALDRLRIGQLNLTWRTPTGDRQLLGTQLESAPFDDELLGRRVQLEGGKLIWPGLPLPEMRLSRATLRHDEGEWFLNESSVQVGARGQMELEGAVKPQQKSWKLEGMLTALDLKELLSPAWRELAEGHLDGSIRGQQENGQPMRWDGELILKNGSIKGLKSLSTVAAYLGRPEFLRPNFEEATLKFEHQGEAGWRIRDLVLFSRNLLRVEGELAGRGEQLEGILWVGIPPGTLSAIPGAETKVFLAENYQSKLGYHWAQVRIRGTWQHLEEDLTERLIQAAGERLFEILPETGEKVLKFTRESATDFLRDPIGAPLRTIEKAPGELLQGVDDTLRELNPILPLPRP